MIRAALAVIAALMLASVALAAPKAKPQPLTNPLTADLNANGHMIYGASNLDAQGGISGGGFCNWVDWPDNCISWLANTVDPRGQFQASAGSLYTRRIGTTYPGTAGELWFQAGPTSADWVRIYPPATG